MFNIIKIKIVENPSGFVLLRATTNINKDIIKDLILDAIKNEEDFEAKIVSYAEENGYFFNIYFTQKEIEDEYTYTIENTNELKNETEEESNENKEN